MKATSVLIALTCLAGAEAAMAQEMPWAKSFDDAAKLAAQQNKLVMADFYTDW